MKSFVLLGLVATGLAIPLTNTPAALDAADADTERAFKTGLAAIETSLLDVSLTTHQLEPTVVAQAKFDEEAKIVGAVDAKQVELEKALRK